MKDPKAGDLIELEVRGQQDRVAVFINVRDVEIWSGAKGGISIATVLYDDGTFAEIPLHKVQHEGTLLQRLAGLVKKTA